MIEKPLIILIFMYAVSFAALGIQYMLGDVLGITLTTWDGIPIKSSILSFINQGTLNTVTQNIAGVNSTYNSTLDAVENSFEIGINMGFELLTLLTGTYIFNLIYLMLGPDSAIFIAGFVIIYAIMLGRTIIAYVRGV